MTSKLKERNKIISIFRRHIIYRKPERHYQKKKKKLLELNQQTVKFQDKKSIYSRWKGRQ